MHTEIGPLLAVGVYCIYVMWWRWWKVHYRLKSESQKHFYKAEPKPHGEEISN